MRKKEDTVKVAARVKKYRLKQNNEKIEIIGLKTEDKEKFLQLKGLQKLTHAAKLKKLIELWDNQYVMNEENSIIQAQSLIKKSNYNINDSISPSVLNNSTLNQFFEKYRISIKVVEKRVHQILEFGISNTHIEEYLLYIKDIWQKNKTLHYLDIVVKKENIELFLQKLEAKEREKEKEMEIYQIYLDNEADKAIEFFKDKDELFEQLLKKNKESIAVKICLNSYTQAERKKSRIIHQVFLQDLYEFAEFPYLSFEDWKNKPENEKYFIT